MPNQRRIGGKFAQDTPTLKLTQALNDALISIRQKHPEVPNVVLVVGASSRTDHGHFAPNSWAGKTTHEIMLSGESLRRDAVDILGTLIHECAHAYAKEQKIQDTSRQGRFHNKRFKEIGEKFGLVLLHDKSIGWSSTSVPTETRKLYAAEISAIRQALKGYRIERVIPVSRNDTVKVACECEDSKVTISRAWWERHGEASMSCDVCEKRYALL